MQPIRALKSWLIARMVVLGIRRVPGAEESLVETLKGLKTHLVAAAAVLAALAGVATGALDWAGFLHAVEAAGIFSALRSGIAAHAGTGTLWLSGAKTYIVCAAAVVGALAGLATGAIGPVDAIQAIVTALMGAFARTGVAKLKTS